MILGTHRHFTGHSPSHVFALVGSRRPSNNRCNPCQTVAVCPRRNTDPKAGRTALAGAKRPQPVPANDGASALRPDELKNLPKGQFIVMKTGTHPMRTRLHPFLDWGITFGEPYLMPEKAARKVACTDRLSLTRHITNLYPHQVNTECAASSDKASGIVATDGPTEVILGDEVELEKKRAVYNTHRHREQETQP